MNTKKWTILVSSLIVLILLIGLILVHRITSLSLKEEAGHTSTRGDVNSSPQKNVEKSKNTIDVEKELDNFHKRFNLEDRDAMKREIMSFMNMLVVKTGAYEEGIAALQKILAENPNNEAVCPRAYEYIVLFHTKSGNYQEAIKQAKILIDKHPTSTEALYIKFNIGLCYEKLSQWEKAKETYTSLLTDEIQENETYKAYKGLGKSKLEKSSRLGLLNVRLGRGLFNQRQHQKAIMRFEQAFRTVEGVKGWSSARISPMLYDDFAEASFLMGQSYQKLEKNVDAKNAYQRVIEQYSHSKEWVDQAKDKLSKME